MKIKELRKVFMNGILNENPTFRLLLGMCPTLAISKAASSGLGMGLAATFVTIIDLLIKAFLPSMSSTLGIYIPLIVVNCIIFARAEAFAFKNPPLPSVADGLGMGLGFTLALTILSSIRECVGLGTIFGVQVMPASYQPMAFAQTSSGGFVFLGLLLLVVNALTEAIAKHKREKAKEEIA